MQSFVEFYLINTENEFSSRYCTKENAKVEVCLGNEKADLALNKIPIRSWIRLKFS